MSVTTPPVVAHHHGDDGKEVPVALDSREPERAHVREEDHGWNETNGTEDLRERRKGQQVNTGFPNTHHCTFIFFGSHRCCICETVEGTYHGVEIDGGEQVAGVEGEEDDGHTGHDEVVEGHVHGRLAAPVRRREQAGYAQRRAALQLWGDKTGHASIRPSKRGTRRRAGTMRS